MANLVHDDAHGRTTLRLIGSDEARKRLGSNDRSLALDPLAKNIAFNIYAAASVQLNVTFQTDDSGLHGVTTERGLRLAEAFDRVIGPTRYATRLKQRRQLDRLSRADVEELGQKIWLDELTARERRLLIDALMPPAPVDDAEQRRLATFALLLWLTARKKEQISQEDLFYAAREPPRAVPPAFRPALDGWLDYQIRDVLAVTHEAVMEAVMEEVDLSSARRRGPALSSDVVAVLLNADGDHDDVLRQLGLLEATESVRDMGFADIFARLRDACQDGVTLQDGLRRWRGGVSEAELCDLALGGGPAAAALLPLAWCLAAHRLMPNDGDAAIFRTVADAGKIFQIGLRDVILPKLEEFARTRRTYLEVMAELITRTVQQHLRVAWQRFAAQGQDVCVLAAGIETWAGIGDKEFRAGRTETRLSVAIDWLVQLNLIGDDGITEEGGRILDRALVTLGETRR